MSITYNGKDEGDNEKYLLSDKGVIIGYIKIKLDLQMIMDIWVEENLRKKRYGTQLMKFAENLFVQKGVKEISTSPINDESYGFFDKLGYTIIGTKTLT
jgi:ribosomal protein S18 acetylase RimI-like enzyme